MIFRFVKSDPGSLFDMSQHFLRKIEMSVQAGADRSPAKRELAQNVNRFLRAVFSVPDLLRVTGKFLAEPDRRRIHQMRPADLDDLPKLFRFRIECAVQFSERRNQTIFQLLRCADMNGGRNYVVARLAHVDVVIGMN